MTPEHFAPIFLLESLNDFWVIDHIIQPVYSLFCIRMKQNFCTYWQCLIDCNAQKKNTGSTIRFRNFSSTIEITYMPVAIEPRRFGKHKIYHIIHQEVRKQYFGCRSSDS